MTFSIASLGGKVHEAVVEVFGQPLTIKYKPYSIADRQRIVKQYADEGLDVASAHFLASIVISWDLIGAYAYERQVDPADPDSEMETVEESGEGGMYPTHAEAIMALPESSEFVNDVLTGMGEARKAGKR